MKKIKMPSRQEFEAAYLNSPPIKELRLNPDGIPFDKLELNGNKAKLSEVESVLKDLYTGHIAGGYMIGFLLREIKEILNQHEVGMRTVIRHENSDIYCEKLQGGCSLSFRLYFARHQYSETKITISDRYFDELIKRLIETI